MKHGIEQYLSRHRRGEFYEFDIKVHRINIPDVVRERVPEGEIERVVQQEMQDDLQGFADWFRGDYGWIQGWSQEGRSGGWLVLEPREPVLNEYGEVEDLHDAHERLKALEEIDQRVRRGVRDLKRRLSSHAFWGEAVPASQRSRKHWDPREKKLQRPY